MEKITFIIDEKLKLDFQVKCKKKKTTMTDVLNQSIKRWLKNEKR